MRILSAIVLVACFVLLVFAGSCKTLALTGKEKYKVDLNNVFATIRDEINNDGLVSEKSVTKLGNILEANREDCSVNGSFVEAEKALTSLKAALNEPEKAFNHQQEALLYATNSQEFLKTEIGGMS